MQLSANSGMKAGCVRIAQKVNSDMALCNLNIFARIQISLNCDLDLIDLQLTGPLLRNLCLSNNICICILLCRSTRRKVSITTKIENFHLLGHA